MNYLPSQFDANSINKKINRITGYYKYVTHLTQKIIVHKLTKLVIVFLSKFKICEGVFKRAQSGGQNSTLWSEFNTMVRIQHYGHNLTLWSEFNTMVIILFLKTQNFLLVCISPMLKSL